MEIHFFKVYFLIFGSLIGSRIGSMPGYEGLSYIEFMVPGLIMLSVITNSYANVASAFYGAKFQKSIEEIKEALSKAFEREQGQWKQVFDAVDMNFKEIRDYANDTFLHADTFWEYRKKDNDLN